MKLLSRTQARRKTGSEAHNLKLGSFLDATTHATHFLLLRMKYITFFSTSTHQLSAKPIHLSTMRTLCRRDIPTLYPPVFLLRLLHWTLGDTC